MNRSGGDALRPEEVVVVSLLEAASKEVLALSSHRMMPRIWLNL